MLISICKSKIHRATVTEANLNYEGSLTVDTDLINAANMIPYQKISVLNVNNGSRLDTYLIRGEKGSGTICLNGPAARLGSVGDKVVIIAYGMLDESEVPTNYEPTVVHVDENNKQTN
ncbi:MAG: aspartate 1-decarboxylase [Leptospiraceae bacterium]|nr:aspartate 1-decarboxylase [Leptospiraceae bacterium]MCP5497043.1 aspartate 1-decarboxylase [Leptospiraceae bacterium]